MKKRFWIVAVFLVLTISGCSISNNDQTRADNEELKKQISDLAQQVDALTEEEESAPNIATSEPASQAGDEAAEMTDAPSTPKKVVYSNEEYGFILNLPADWSDFVATERLLNWGTNGNSNSIDFGFEEQDNLFNISMHIPSQWSKIQAEDGPKPTYLGENNNYIFGIGFGHDAANEALGQKLKDINNIFLNPDFFQIIE